MILRDNIVPSYQEGQIKKPSAGWRLNLVTSPGMERNTLSLQELDEKLEELGLVEINGKIILLDSEEAHDA